MNIKYMNEYKTYLSIIRTTLSSSNATEDTNGLHSKYVSYRDVFCQDCLSFFKVCHVHGSKRSSTLRRQILLLERRGNLATDIYTKT